MNQHIWNKAAVYGIILALVSVFFMVLQTLLMSSAKWLNILFWIIKLAGTLGLLFYFMKDFGKGKETYTYADAFRFGLAVSFCSSIIAAGYYYLHVMFIFPDTATQFSNALLMGFEQAGVTAEDFNTDKLIARLPLILMISQFIWFNILGLLWSSLLASGARHKITTTPFES
ncbi:MAG: DUF4199 domain-containing protein [Bacteroidales bacterium]|jgi:hypothetical protein|nr:DUF4199 domain-containing protein [Bacteroidales bacterium]MDD2264007.1 DUF4199 domain-containing protein [Bacteroidales bacterium]MDD2831241.1 DUF4199 domain-containing protein [Bacteroidales bacterium]MDD3208646.1 DUF4199 domain-containing protein [Bacteroidales bacterium]MDD3697209.1 DUF4199 domain-containing protein [Bacteroidales bacterium]